MPHRLTHVFTLAALAATAVSVAPAAADDWWGSATCKIHAQKDPDSTGKGAVVSDETHTWTIVIPQQKSIIGSIPVYVENWTVKGNGSNDDLTWETNGKASGGTLEIFVSASTGNLQIGRFSSQQSDPQGILVTPKAGGNQFRASVGELGFPNIPPAPANSKSVKDNPPSTTTMGTGGRYQVPSDATLTTTCSWDFEYGSPPPMVVYVPFVVETVSWPRSLINELKKVEEGKPTPGGIRPAVPTTLSIFFGGPGGGSVTAPMEFTCFSDCTPPVGLNEGQTITLTATSDATSLFAGWGGPSCSGTSPTCTVTLGASNRVIAYFRSKFKTVAAGAYHTCALRPAGDVVCWGYNAEGEVGTGTESPKPLAPSAVIGITNAVAIAAGGFHTCALLVGGTVTCWGKGNDGQLGNPMSFPAASATPMTVSGISGAVAVTAGGAHTCVVLAGGSASCWGLNKDNQLGATSFPPDHTPTPVTATAAGGPLTKQIAAGAYHTCAIVAADSTVTCWGLNGDGQAPAWVLISDPGGPAAGCIIPPGGGDCVSAVEGSADTIPVIKLNNVTTIAASIGVGQLLGGPPLGGYHTVALDSSGMDWGWGNNNDGQLLDVHGGPYVLATKDTSPPGPAVKIAAGAYHTCMLVGPVGSVFCRGNNNNSQSGSTPPGFVPTMAVAVDLAAGGYHTCAVIVNPPSTPADGSVACWGRNWEGEVDGTFHGSDVGGPLVVPGIP